MNEDGPENPCATHREVESCADCAECAKRYCGACLVRRGPRKIVTCVACMKPIAERLQKKARDRELLSTIGIVAAIAAGIYAAQRRTLDAVSLAAGAAAILAAIVAGVAWAAQRRVKRDQELALWSENPLDSPPRGR